MRYMVTKYIEAASMKDALKLESKAEVEYIECVDNSEPDNFKVGYGRNKVV